METEQHIAEKPMNDWIPKGINQKVPRINENENTTYQNLWDTEKAMLRGKFIVLSAYIKKNSSLK
jgi:hypothetical protein